MRRLVITDSDGDWLILQDDTWNRQPFPWQRLKTIRNRGLMWDRKIRNLIASVESHPSRRPRIEPITQFNISDGMVDRKDTRPLNSDLALEEGLESVVQFREVGTLRWGALE